MGNPTVEKVVADKQPIVEPTHVVARHEYVDASARQYGKALAYAQALNERWPETEGRKNWYDVGHNEVNDFAKEVTGEKDALASEFEAVGIKSGTVRKRWFDVRAKAREEREGVEEKDDSTGGNPERPLAIFIPEWALTGYKRMARAEKRTDIEAKSMKLAQQICELHKIDLSSI